MKNFYLGLREHATEIINYETKEIISLTKEEKKKLIMYKEDAIYAKRNLIPMIKIKNTIK